MSKEYFSFDPADSIALHGTEEQAKEVCFRALEDERQMAFAEGEWSDEVTDIIWGVVLGRVRAAGENDYTLVNMDAQTEIETLRAQLAAAREALRHVVHQQGCDALAWRPCDCDAQKRHDEAVGNARRALGLEV